MNILITGSNGFVGSRLMYYLESEGYQVHGIDKSPECIIKPHPQTVIGDIRNQEDYHVFDNLEFDLIIHAAAEKHDFGISSKKYFSNNEYGTKILMQFANSRNINKVIYYSTVSVYGHQDKPCDETSELRSNTVYGDSKLAGERVIEKWWAMDKTRSAIFLRPSVIYGPHNFANMYNLINQLYKMPWVTIGDGENIKSMVSLENIIAQTEFVMNRIAHGIQIYNCIDKPYLKVKEIIDIICSHKHFYKPVFHIPSGLAVFIGRIFDFVGKILHKDLPVNSDRMIKFVTSTDYRAEKIRSQGYIQKHTIREELDRTIRWYLKEVRGKKI